MKKITHSHQIISIALVLLIIASCETPLKVTNDYDKNANFQQYKTFTLNKVTDPQRQSISQLNQNRINNAVIAEMSKKGFQPSDNPDLLVNIAVVLQDKKSVTANTNYYGYGGFYRPYGWGGGLGATGYTTYNVQNYKEGSLIIEVIDAKTKNLLWEGIGNKEIDGPVKDPDMVISAAVTKIMAGFPPGTMKK
jgi:Domain of unknown function (DUF4136)